MVQAQTMEMMYRIIADELKAMDNKDMHPEDYLNFFCLGNREEPPSNGIPESEKSTDKSAAVICCFIFSLIQKCLGYLLLKLI
jgi:phospholipase D1/2